MKTITSDKFVFMKEIQEIRFRLLDKGKNILKTFRKVASHSGFRSLFSISFGSMPIMRMAMMTATLGSLSKHDVDGSENVI